MINLSFVTKQNIEELSKLIGSTVYLVGGAVRDALAGFSPTDYDIASAKTPEEVITALDGSVFSVATTAQKFGTLKLAARGESYEYTAFRRDHYPNSGQHVPTKVTFTDSIEEDAKRRDFKINAMYYDVVEEQLIDLLGGFADVKRKLVSTTIDPEQVLREDGLRILRLVRTAAETGFDIEAETYKAAQSNAHLLQDIAVERIREELDKILVADTKNGIEDAHYRGVRLLYDIGAMDYILPELRANDGYPQRPERHKYDVLEHIFQTVKEASPEVRLAALLHDVGKAPSKQRDGNMRKHPETSAEIADAFLARLKYPKHTREEIVKLVLVHMYDIKCVATEDETRLFVQDNIEIIDKLISLKHADRRAKGMGDQYSPSALHLGETRKNMLIEGVPFSIKDLLVNGDDLISLGVPPRMRATILDDLLRATATDTALLARDNQLEYIKKALG